MARLLVALVTGAAICSAVSHEAEHKRTVFVNCEAGSDDADGSRARPFRTPMRARDLVRAIHPFAAAPIEVDIFGDCYPRNANGDLDFSLPVLELEAGIDSGSQRAPIAYTGSKRSRLLSGMPIAHSAWVRSVSNPHVWHVDLLDLSVDPALFGSFLPPENPGGRTMGKCTTHQLELFYGGKPMTMARYPNLSPSGDFQWLHISSVQDKQARFQVSDDRVLGWADEVKEGNAWVHGYWSFDWADSFLKVTEIAKDATTGDAQVSVEGPVLYGFSAKAKFYGINLLAELDAPGEYYLDRRANSSSYGTLYFWPPADLALSESFVSLGDYTVLLGDTASRARRTARQLDDFAAQRARAFARAAAAGTSSASTPASPGNWSDAETASVSGEEAASFARLRHAEALDRDARRHLRADAARREGVSADDSRFPAPVVTGWGNWDYYWEEQVRSARYRQTEPMLESSLTNVRAHAHTASGTLDYVTLSGFGVHFGQVAGVRGTNGRHLVLDSLEITNHGGVGLALDGAHLRVTATEVAHVGCGAVQVSGGSDMCLGWDPNECEHGNGLKDAGNLVERCRLHDFGRVCRAYMPGIAFEGAGHTIRRNEIFNAPHAGIFGRGNDCSFTHNLLRDLAYESTDTGGFTTGRSWCAVLFCTHFSSLAGRNMSSAAV